MSWQTILHPAKSTRDAIPILSAAWNIVPSVHSTQKKKKFTKE